MQILATGRSNENQLKAAPLSRMAIWSRKNAFRGAFTLIEIVVVMAIIALVISLALPNFAAYYEAERMRSLSRRIIACMKYAHQYAVSRRCIAVVSLDENERVIQVLVPKEHVSVDAIQSGEIDIQSESVSELIVGTNRYQLPSELVMLLNDRWVEFSPERFVPAKERQFGVVKIPDGVEVEIVDTESGSKLDSIMFRQDGTATGAMVNMKGWRGFQITIQVDPVTARVSAE
ncbi:MAG: prepilin-type N-terminal cleavage/methylation domain-containing protein [Armatimonadota bacterium]|nr:prepilin-type N-terminal cleavage/methylation domain-containing protein [Armatimonadota bacterium]MCX7776887.1 prepilin-type N-terminal cleavage/methylation domain-containing protein [Armatimonadota bacterium]MDW8024427.1 prepilin-type N-terminal cleavage/methylation domain-containing protein [Armatimonadota bacterium]